MNEMNLMLEVSKMKNEIEEIKNLLKKHNIIEEKHNIIKEKLKNFSIRYLVKELYSDRWGNWDEDYFELYTTIDGKSFTFDSEKEALHFVNAHNELFYGKGRLYIFDEERNKAKRLRCSPLYEWYVK